MRLTLTVLAAVALFTAAACDGDKDDPAVSTGSATPTTAITAPSVSVTPSSAAGTPSPSTSPSPPPSASATSVSATASPTGAAGQVIDIVVKGGRVSIADKTVKVKRGTAVTLRITSDVADEVHVHGYDLTKSVPAAGTVEIPFKADLAGGWEVELHDKGLVLVKLQVS